MTARILVVEDEPAIQTLLAVNLEHAGYRVAAAVTAEIGKRFIDIALPDLVVLDWNLPGMSGLEFMRRLRAEPPTRHLPIIMLSARVEEADKIQGLSSGADDYVTKPFSPKELLARIKALLRRRQPHGSMDALEGSGLRIDLSLHRVTASGQTVNLSASQFRLLHFFMTHAERLYSRDQIREQVWGDSALIETRTIDVHIRRLRAALEATGHDAMIETVRGNGYRFSPKALSKEAC